MQELLSKDYRPNCLLIDEIDGAPAVSWFFFFSSGLLGYIS
jgi:hypothetical protein